jgi:hypothetical protein
LAVGRGFDAYRPGLVGELFSLPGEVLGELEIRGLDRHLGALAEVLASLSPFSAPA